MADPNETPQSGTRSEVMPDLPGSGTPPIEGRQWVQVKIAVWVIAGLIAAAVAWGVASVASRVVSG